MNTTKYDLKFNISLDDINKIIDFRGDLQNDYTEKDISKIIYNHTLDNSHCEHCEYGEKILYIIKLKDGNYILLKKWTGCMTYNSENEEIYISSNENILIDECFNMTNKYNNKLIEHKIHGYVSHSLSKLVKLGMTQNDRITLVDFIEGLIKNKKIK